MCRGSQCPCTRPYRALQGSVVGGGPVCLTDPQTSQATPEPVGCTGAVSSFTRGLNVLRGGAPIRARTPDHVPGPITPLPARTGLTRLAPSRPASSMDRKVHPTSRTLCPPPWQLVPRAPVQPGLNPGTGRGCSSATLTGRGRRKRSTKHEAGRAAGETACAAGNSPAAYPVGKEVAQMATRG